MPAGKQPQPSAVILDGRTLQSTPESGARADYDGHKRKKGSKVHAAVDTLGHLLALKVTAANKQERAQVADLVEEVQQATGESVEVAFVDQGYTGEEPAEQAAKRGIRLIVVKLEEAKKGFVPRRLRRTSARHTVAGARLFKRHGQAQGSSRHNKSAVIYENDGPSESRAARSRRTELPEQQGTASRSEAAARR